MDKNEIFAAWENMPEFVQNKQTPYAKINILFVESIDDDDPFSVVIVRFANAKTLAEFSEFLQTPLTPETTDIVRCEPSGGLEEFSEVIGQPLTLRTKSIWHPKLVRGLNAKKRYVDAT